MGIFDILLGPIGGALGGMLGGGAPAAPAPAPAAPAAPAGGGLGGILGNLFGGGAAAPANPWAPVGNPGVMDWDPNKLAALQFQQQVLGQQNRQAQQQMGLDWAQLGMQNQQAAAQQQYLRDALGMQYQNAAADRNALYGDNAASRSATLYDNQLGRNQQYQNAAADRSLQGLLGQNALNQQYAYQDSALNRQLADSAANRNMQGQLGMAGLNQNTALQDIMQQRQLADGAQGRGLEAMLAQNLSNQNVGLQDIMQQRNLASQQQMAGQQNQLGQNALNQQYAWNNTQQLRDLANQQAQQQAFYTNDAMARNQFYGNAGADRDTNAALAQRSLDQQYGNAAADRNASSLLAQNALNQQYANSAADREAQYGYLGAQLGQQYGYLGDQLNREYGYKGDELNMRYGDRAATRDFMAQMIPGMMGQIGGIIGGLNLGGAGGGMQGFQDVNSGQFAALPGASPLGQFATPMTAQAPTQGDVMGAANAIGGGGATANVPNVPFAMPQGAQGELAQLGGDARRMSDSTARMSMLQKMLPAQAQLGQSLNNMRANLGLGHMGALANLQGDQYNRAASYLFPMLGNMSGMLGAV